MIKLPETFARSQLPTCQKTLAEITTTHDVGPSSENYNLNYNQNRKGISLQYSSVM